MTTPRSGHSLAGTPDGTANIVAAAPLLDVQTSRSGSSSREETVTRRERRQLHLGGGEVLCILGESGSGKSVTLRALMRLLPKRAQDRRAGCDVGGQDVLAMRRDALRDLARRRGVR